MFIAQANAKEYQGEFIVLSITKAKARKHGKTVWDVICSRSHADGKTRKKTNDRFSLLCCRAQESQTKEN